MIGRSPEAVRIRKWIQKLAKTDENVLLIGEAGCGKKTVAKKIHGMSRRASFEFIEISCSKPGDSGCDRLFEKEEDRILSADNGTLYLEYLDRLNPSSQIRLLNLLREKRIRNKDGWKNLDIRIMASSTQPDLLIRPTVRMDLLALVNEAAIIIPPLRQRKQDIPFLFYHILEETSRMSGTEMPAVPLELFESFMKYEWPGNIEELQSAVKNLTIAPSGSLSIESLPFELYLRPMEILDEKELPDAVCEVEIFMIRQALRKSRGNVRSAARSLRIAEPVLRRKIKKYELGWIRD